VPQTCSPGAPSAEVCDGLDNDCNGVVDDGLGTTTCGVGTCMRAVDSCIGGVPQTCSPGAPSAEVCDGLDNDCNGVVDDGLGTTTCGIGECRRTVDNCVSGLPQTCTPGAPSPEACDGRDNNCDGRIDEDGVCEAENSAPECGAAVASAATLWPPNHKYVKVSVGGVTDADGDPVVITITGLTQDEPLNGLGDGDTCPDAAGVGSSTAMLRAERAGTPKVPGDGRVYHVSFTASDGRGGTCGGTVLVCVPHDQRPGATCVDQGPRFDSTGPCN